MTTKPLSRNMKRALNALITSTSIKEAAEKTGLHRRTLERYLKDEDFQIEHDKMIHTVTMRALAFRSKDTQKNTSIFRELRDNPEAPANVRLRAAIYLETSLHEKLLYSEIVKAVDELEDLAIELQKSAN